MPLPYYLLKLQRGASAEVFDAHPDAPHRYAEQRFYAFLLVFFFGAVAAAAWEAPPRRSK